MLRAHDAHDLALCVKPEAGSRLAGERPSADCRVATSARPRVIYYGKSACARTMCHLSSRPELERARVGSGPRAMGLKWSRLGAIWIAKQACRA